MTVSPIRRALHALGPAIPVTSSTELLRAAIGIAFGLGFTAFVLNAIPGGDQFYIRMLASFGATATLVFVVPNSPLAQPWSVFTGNTASALMTTILCLYLADTPYLMPIAAGLSIAIMIALRALHPPGGAIAVLGALNPQAVQEMGFKFALSPAIGSVCLIAAAIVYAHMTGRRYPFRQFPEQNNHGTADRRPSERLGIEREDLQDILAQYRQSLNLGVEDLARLIGAVEMRAAGKRTGALTAGDIMSRDLVTILPDAPLRDVAEIFRIHGFTSLPVVDKNGAFVGVIFQLHLIRKAHESAFGFNQGFRSAITKLIDPKRPQPLYARDVMTSTIPTTTADAPVSSLLPALADGDCDAVPVLDDGRISGIVTRTDMIAAVARQSLLAENHTE